MSKKNTGLEHPWGQLFMVGLPGPDLDSGTEELIRDCGVGNFILFRRNVVDPLQLFRLCRDLKSACRDQDMPPPLISIDQEGGRVARLGPPFTQLPAASEMAGAPDAEIRAEEVAHVMARELKLVGCNMNLAPVLDLTAPQADPVMLGRTLGSDPDRVGYLGGLIIEGLQKNGVLATAKHFPGIGSVKLDPHQELPTIGRSAAEIEAGDLVPFQRAISAGVAAVMTAHVIYTDLDASVPATLSHTILTELLRDSLRFNGLVIADDMEMGAIEKNFSIQDSCERAFLAGVDLLLICHEQAKIMQAVDAIRVFVGKNDKAGRRLEESLRRILKAKENVIDTAGNWNEASVREYFNL